MDYISRNNLFGNRQYGVIKTLDTVQVSIVFLTAILTPSQVNVMNQGFMSFYMLYVYIDGIPDVTY